MTEDDEDKKDAENAEDAADESAEDAKGNKPGGKSNKPGGKGKDGKAVKARCIKKRQWKGRIIRPEDDRVFEFPKGIPAGFEEYFKPIN